MKLKPIHAITEQHDNYSKEVYSYPCPCGEGLVKEAHLQYPGTACHRVIIECEKCADVYEPEGDKELRHWKLVKKDRGPKELTPEEEAALQREQEKRARRTGLELDWPVVEEDK